MKIIRPYAKILYAAELPYALEQIEYAARISHRSEEESGLHTQRFIKAVVIDHGDLSVIEHVTVPLLAEFKKLIPLLYDDIEPGARQIDNLRLPE